MDGRLTDVAERLVDEFADLPGRTVVTVVVDCADEFPQDDPHFVEQAARARLAAHRDGEDDVTASP